MSAPMPASGARPGIVAWIVALAVGLVLAVQAIFVAIAGGVELMGHADLAVALPFAQARASGLAAEEGAQAGSPPDLVAFFAANGVAHSPVNGPAFTGAAMAEKDRDRAWLLMNYAHRLTRRDTEMLVALEAMARDRHDAPMRAQAVYELTQQAQLPAEVARRYLAELSDPALRAATVAVMHDTGPWREKLLRGGSGVAPVAVLVPLLADLSAAGIGLPPEIVGRLVAQQLYQGQDPDGARALWLAENPDRDPFAWPDYGLVHDGAVFTWLPDDIAVLTGTGTDRSLVLTGGEVGSVAASGVWTLAPGHYRVVIHADHPGFWLRIPCIDSERYIDGETIRIPASCPVAQVELVLPQDAGDAHVNYAGLRPE